MVLRTPMMWKVSRFSILFAALLLSVACAKHRAAVAIKPPEPARGKVSFRFLADTDSAAKQNSNGWEYHPPHLVGEAVMPSYPERPLARRFGSALVIVGISVNPAGEVTNVSARPGSTPGPFAADFFLAVETAVRKWKFTRPEWWLLEEGIDINGDGKPDYQKVIDIKPTSAAGDVEFLFRLAGGTAEVQAR
jgi:hypothetical protein